MDLDIIERLNNIKLMVEEGTEVEIQTSHCQQVLEKCSLSIIGRFLTDKPLNL